ncbi:endolytic transglycosylase MltG [Alkalibacterium sp. MB6]|uniref:endolytic transglycosylase MltG n=1 Tax=Alkalibacterium sp. MB6 TaxID=2081965 RepID=UPI0013797DC2|nr:endolytic transglycosylase MltG [Alkalibacterium sp. MB6]
MSKKNIRLMALGFFLSGLLLLMLTALPFSNEQSDNEQTAEAIESELHYLEEKLVSLELENEELMKALEATEGGSIEEEEPEVEVEVEAEVDEEEEVEDTVQTYTVVVQEGQPSSVVANQLEEFGLIEDRHAFNTYLEESDFYKRVRAGRYTVTSDMNRDQLVQAIIN